MAAHRLTGKGTYLEQARRFADMAVECFWQDNPLPRASKQTGHYEAITGGDSLALALLEVHAATHGLTNHIPSNTINDFSLFVERKIARAIALDQRPQVRAVRGPERTRLAVVEESRQ